MRKWLVGCLAVGLVLAGGLIALLRPQHCPVGRAAAGRIEEGMTRAEVHAVLGGPPGDYRTRPHPHRYCAFVDGPAVGMMPFVERWGGDEGTVSVHYSHQTPGHERAMPGTFEEAMPYHPGALELARWRLGKLREAWLP